MQLEKFVCAIIRIKFENEPGTKAKAIIYYRNH